MKAQALKHGSILKKKHKTIRFKQLRMLKPHIDLNTKFKTEAKNNVKKKVDCTIKKKERLQKNGSQSIQDIV